MAHKDRIQLICQGSHRIVILSEGKLAAVIGGRFIAVGNCTLYRLIGDFFPAYILQEFLQLAELICNIADGILIFFIGYVNIKARDLVFLFQIRKRHHVSIAGKVCVDGTFGLRYQSCHGRSQKNSVIGAHGFRKAL